MDPIENDVEAQQIGAVSPATTRQLCAVKVSGSGSTSSGSVRSRSRSTSPTTASVTSHEHPQQTSQQAPKQPTQLKKEPPHQVVLVDPRDQQSQTTHSTQQSSNKQPPGSSSSSILRQRSLHTMPSFDSILSHSGCDECVGRRRGGHEEEDEDDDFLLGMGVGFPVRLTTPSKSEQRLKRATTCGAWLSGCLCSPIAKVMVAFTILIGIPILHWGGLPPCNNLATFLEQIQISWMAIFHISIWPLVVCSAFRGITVAHHCRINDYENPPRYRNSVLILMLVNMILVVSVSQLQVILPSWVWNPFAWGHLHVYRPHQITPLMRDICLDYQVDDNRDDPLCLSPHSWKVLGGEVLDPNNREDVETVVRGIKYARDVSGGIIINVMARDTIDAIKPLRENVEALVPFFRDKLAVVVYENDSIDGTRYAFKKWAAEAQGYVVDVMSCGEENPDCVTGESHRYDAVEAKDYFKSSAIGRMAEFRQKIVDYVMTNPAYEEYSHMLIQDLDLKVSWSPLGVLHTFGIDVTADAAVASSGRQIWPGSLGSIIPPYDFSAFRALSTPHNKKILAMHSAFCGLEPDGDRWRNACDAVSVAHFMLVLSHDRMHGNRPYAVESAFNGATMYPLKLIKESNAKYDVGDDGQRCEHIGFNIGLKRPMFVNPKWNFYVSPENPGGPSGIRALHNVMRIVFTPKLSLAIGVPLLASLGLFVYAVMTLSVIVLYPILCWIFCCFSRASIRRRRKYSEENPILVEEESCCERLLPGFILQPYTKMVTVKHI